MSTRVIMSVTLTPPIQALAGPRALCLEFQPPGRTHRAADLTFVLTDAQGGRDTLRSRLDRTGESTICWRDSLAVDRTFVAFSMHAGQPLPISRHIWRSPESSGSR